MSENKQFTLKSANADFALRQKNVFDQLLVLEPNRRPTNSDDTEMDVDEDDVHSKVSSPKEQRAITRKLRGKESIFKKPQNPVSKNYMKKIPDFKKNPHKWTRYSLEDVNDEDMSDRSNTKTALSFLEELKERKISEVPLDDSEKDVPQKIVFKKQRRHESSPEIKEDPESLKATFRSSKVVMPEYVVGQKLKKDKKKKRVEKGRELKLDHLLEDE
ncbi:U5 small nuclear ribonucleoprotein TSSC4 [Diabrotica undecimpunctata]|uniref:U5 small nuclear ribonucleoprotein TSSC4 n=1 Tax=Diabrotica undecimpunctata TaxID=50387 RepID=UPI003B634EA3